jgi:hypothetical protein
MSADLGDKCLQFPIDLSTHLSHDDLRQVPTQLLLFIYL